MERAGAGAARRGREELERAEERKRRLQRERSRRYRAAKLARRGRDEPYEPYYERGAGGAGGAGGAPPRDDSDSEAEEPPTLCKAAGAGDTGSDDSPAPSPAERAPPGRPTVSLVELLSMPSHELDYSTVHSLMFHWLQT